MTNALARLRELHARGLLEKAYDQVPALLAEDAGPVGPVGLPATAAAGGDLAKAGRLLARLDPDAVLAHHPHTPVVTVAVTGQSTVGHVIDPLTGELARHGLLLRPVPGEYGTYLRDLTDPRSPLRTPAPDLTLCLLDAETLFEQVPAVWRPEDVEAAGEEALSRCAALAGAVPGTLVLNTLPLPRTYSRQLVDHRSRARLGAVWREFNARLLRLTESADRLVVIDLEPLVGDGGPVTDPRLERYGKVRFGAELLAAYAREVAHLARAVRGLVRKCLVLDLDHTLWDGVLGEDGPDGIAAAGTLRGEAFGAFQRCVRQLSSQGVLLAVSSKNDEEPVLEVLRGHPDMTLREQDFVRINANWRPKDGNLLDIARVLDLGPDALVFADDSPAERARVRHGAPEVAVVPLDDEPALHVTRLLTDGWFDTLRLTDEDRARTGEYHRQRERRALRQAGASHEEFLRALEVTLDLGPPRGHEYARLSQLSLRTNQFNLTGGGLPEPRLAALAADPDRLLLAARTADRFGANGLVAAVLGTFEAGALRLDGMWLSCRVLGRDIERAVLAVLLAHARDDLGLSAVTARYVPTARNHRVRDFYPSCGFTERPAPAGREDISVEFHHDLTRVPAVPGHVRVTATLGRRPADESR
ncbi:HAD-superfamily phosphatase, subfamily IIIC:FkbH [Streptomyces cirratus]|uniref:HAD-superfamily phosphatase, subfamily IIIC:FkbH n=1 Tax=Streptomyces cirratus TaxID=68187 RepID=A0ABQ3F2T2_9ACTN|nr:HAD-IIIC family phosphatase [Streptomyces cirratus]GHB74837.1 HAD-superfamily phosphatase, subfamily IIIC:FkbH [Streptomyces cirratus]